MIRRSVSIIGAGRRRNGIGEYIAKYFHQHGAVVSSVLGTSEKTSLEASQSLRKYGVEARAYTDFDQMVEKEKPEIAVIASPSFTHYEYLIKCLQSGLHILCEKPFIWDHQGNIRKRIDDIFERAREKELTIAMNSQWPFSINAYEAISGKVVIQHCNTFNVAMSPPFPGKEMIPESVPHVLSLLYTILGFGEIENLSFEPCGEERMEIKFSYLFDIRSCDVSIRLAHQPLPPRDFSFGLNDKIVFRTLGSEDYDIYFHHQGKKMKIADPLELSVKNFLDALETKMEPFVGTLHIFHNMSLLNQIDDGFKEFAKHES